MQHCLPRLKLKKREHALFLVEWTSSTGTPRLLQGTVRPARASGHAWLQDVPVVPAETRLLSATIDLCRCDSMTLGHCRRTSPHFAEQEKTVSQKSEHTLLTQARCRSLLSTIVLAVAASTSAADTMSMEAVKAHLKLQREKIDGLHLRIRRETTLPVDPKLLSIWRLRSALPKYLGTDEVLVAFKGDNRYYRLLALDYEPTVGAGPPLEGADGTDLFIDETNACNVTTFFQRRLADNAASQIVPHHHFQYESAPLGKAQDAFAQSEYLTNVGLAVPDPTGKDEAQRNLQQMGHLPELLQRWPYVVLEKTAEVDGASCVVLEGRMQCRLPAGKRSESKKVTDRLWLDVERGLAIQKRETHFDGWLTRVLNSDFEEVLPGFWLPKESKTLSFVPPDGGNESRDRLLMIRQMRLRMWVANQTPDDFFDLLAKRRSPHRLPSAYHWRLTRPGFQPEMDIEEGWTIRGIGRRVETRRGKESKLVLLVVETPRWHFSYDLARNLVVASPSLLEASWPQIEAWTTQRESINRLYEELTAIFAQEKDRRRGKDVERITYYFPADFVHGGDWPIHSLFPKGLIEPSGNGFRTRTHWWDPKTDRSLGRRCGCKPPKHGEVSIDYPEPETFPKQLFTFQVPRDALLEINDPALGRKVYSEATTLPDLR